MNEHRPRHVSGRRRMPGLRNWRHLQREGLKRQPQQHNATTDNNGQQRNHDAMTNEKARSSTRACLLPNNGTTRQARHLHLAGIRATQLAILAITSFSAALPPEVTLQGTQLSKHRHLRLGQCASREPITANTLLHRSLCRCYKCPPRPVRTRSYSHHGLIHLHHFHHKRGPLHQWQNSATPFKAGDKSVCHPSSGKKPNTVGNLPRRRVWNCQPTKTRN